MVARCAIHVTSLMLCFPYINALRLSTAGATDVSAKVFSAVKDDPYILEDWLEHHMEVVGPSNIYLFDDASELPLTIQILERAAQKGVIVVWSGANETSVPLYTYAGSKALHLQVPTMTTSSASPFQARRKSCFDALGKQISEFMPGAYIFPLDSDEFVGYLRSPRQQGSQNAAWQIQFDKQGFMYALSKHKDFDEHHLGEGGYFATHMVDAIMCDLSLAETGGTDTRIARKSVIDPYDTGKILKRLGIHATAKEAQGEQAKGCRPSEAMYKKFVRAGNWKQYGLGAHTMGTCNGAPWRWSRIVLVHYGARESMTISQNRQKLEARFVQAGWQKRFNLTLEQVHHLSKYVHDPSLCNTSGITTSWHYCDSLWQADKIGDHRHDCSSDLASRGITVM